MTTVLKPILHGRDHACGGADPIPGICNSYQSVQDGVWDFTWGGIPTDQEITNWPRIVIPGDHWDYHVAAGHGLYARWHCQAWSNAGPTGIIRVDMQPQSGNVQDLVSSDDPVTDDGWVALAATGFLMNPGSGMPLPFGGNVPTWMRLQPNAGSIFHVRGGVVRVEWTADADDLPQGDYWTGTYPIMDTDVAANADILVTKIDHPGGTDVFLRGDATWSNLILEVEY